MKTFLAVLFSALLFTGSAAFAQNDNMALAKEVMDIHDEAMAKMTHMHELRLKLQEVEEKSGKSPETTAAIKSLKSAHVGMMEWMRSYKAPKTEAEFETARDYLLSEKVKIEEVSKAINLSIENGEKLL